MKSNHDITTFSKLHEAAVYYLDQSFVQLEECFRTELAGYFMFVELDKIDPTTQDREIISKLEFPKNPVELLQAETPNALSDETSTQMFEAWQIAQFQSRTKFHNFPKDYKLVAIQILGHINTFGFFIETLVNRHLLYQKFVGKIDDKSYSKISSSRVMERLSSMFKDEISKGNLHLNDIRLLFRLRNKTVHYTPDNANALQPKITELVRIWKQATKVLLAMEKSEQFNDEQFSEMLIRQINYFEDKWIE